MKSTKGVLLLVPICTTLLVQLPYLVFGILSSNVNNSVGAIKAKMQDSSKLCQDKSFSHPLSDSLPA